jgi:hypothetical protein
MLSIPICLKLRERYVRAKTLNDTPSLSSTIYYVNASLFLSYCLLLG